MESRIFRRKALRRRRSAALLISSGADDQWNGMQSQWRSLARHGRWMAGSQVSG
jgi:hypothetical protein